MQYVECLKNHYAPKEVPLGYDAVDQTFYLAISLVETPPRIVKYKKTPVQ